MPREAFPRSITFPWLVGRLRRVESAEEWTEIIEELRRRHWRDLDPPSNFRGMMKSLVPYRVRLTIQ